jgi:hypothetical protein
MGDLVFFFVTINLYQFIFQNQGLQRLRRERQGVVCQFLQGFFGSVPNVLSNHVKLFHRESFGNKPHTFGTLPASKKRVGF